MSLSIVAFRINRSAAFEAARFLLYLFLIMMKRAKCYAKKNHKTPSIHGHYDMLTATI